MKARVKWVEDVCFMGESESGHAVILDGSPEIGGRNLGMRPMEMLLVSMGACSSIDVVTILKKARQEISNCVAEISAERAEEIPKVFTKIHVNFVVTGRGLNVAQVERAVNYVGKSR
jgi:putative redox protein